MAGVSLLATCVATILGFGLGALWYGPLFGKQWMSAVGVTPETIRQDVSPARTYGATFVLGLVAFSLSTAGGLLLAKFMNLFLKDKINPLIGSAGVSAVPMAARVSQIVARVEDKHNYILMHAMGSNVAGVIGTALSAGLFLNMLK